MQNTFTTPNKTYRDLWDLVLLGALATVLTAVAIWMLASQYAVLPGSGTARDSVAQDTAEANFIEVTGVRVIRVGLASGGGMLDLRYQIVDPDKADVVHDPDNPPMLVDEATGQTVSRPWHDHSHDKDLHFAITYFEILMNPGGVLKPGSMVTVVIGDARLEHVLIQ